MSDIDFAALIEPVARHFWGEPPKGFVTKLSIRWGNNGSKSVNLQTGEWFDHEAGEGGGVLALIMREETVDKAGAMQWLQDNGFITARDASEPRQGARELDRTPEAPPEDDRPPASSADEGKKVMVEAYDYVNRDGERLYQVVRFQWKKADGSWVLGKSGNPKKAFAQRRKDASGQVVWNLDGIGHTIYRHNLIEAAVAEGKTIFLPEGEKDVHTLEEWGFVASTNSGGAQNWRPEFTETFRGADVVILGDDDEAGRKRTEEIALTLRGVAGRLRVIASWGGPKDVTDWRDKAGGTAEAFMQILQTSADWRPAPPASSMGAVGIHQLHDPSLRHDFLIDGFLDRQGVAMMPGASGSGKTFVVLEASMCVSLGREFFGMPVKKGLVLYQAGEGKQGVAKRIDGWMQDRGISPHLAIPFQMLTKRVNLFVDDKDTDALIDEGKRWSDFYGEPVRLVTIDTYNKAITGANEISGQDMGKVLSRMERISTELDCAVLSPIHKSKEGSMRGHTSLKGDVSNVIEVNELNIRDHNGRIIRTIVLDKNKDGEKGKPLRFVLRQVVLGDDERGKPITTCVVDRPDGDEEEYVRQGKLSLNQILVLKALKQAAEDDGEPAPAGIRAVASIRTVVRFPAWKERLAKTWQYGASENEPDKRKAELDRVLAHAGKVLLAGDYIGRDNDLGVVWLTGKEDRPKREPKPVERSEQPSPYMTAADIEVPF